jgi:hypothetical protein
MVAAGDLVDVHRLRVVCNMVQLVVLVMLVKSGARRVVKAMTAPVCTDNVDLRGDCGQADTITVPIARDT